MQPTPFKAPRALRGDVRRGLLVGLTPLARLVVIVGLALALTALGRVLTAGQGFFTEQQVGVIVLAVGLVLAAVLYAAGCLRALRRVGQWQRAGDAWPAAVALWALAATALLALVPVLLALVLPQHAAP